MVLLAKLETPFKYVMLITFTVPEPEDQFVNVLLVIVLIVPRPPSVKFIPVIEEEPPWVMLEKLLFCKVEGIVDEPLSVIKVIEPEAEALFLVKPVTIELLLQILAAVAVVLEAPILIKVIIPVVFIFKLVKVLPVIVVVLFSAVPPVQVI